MSGPSRQVCVSHDQSRYLSPLLSSHSHSYYFGSKITETHFYDEIPVSVLSCSDTTEGEEEEEEDSEESNESNTESDHHESPREVIIRSKRQKEKMRRKRRQKEVLHRERMREKIVRKTNQDREAKMKVCNTTED